MSSTQKTDIRRIVYTTLSLLFYLAGLFFTVFLAVEMVACINGENFEGLAIIVLLPASLLIGAAGALLSTLFAALGRRRLRVAPPTVGKRAWRIGNTLLLLLPVLTYIAVEAVTILVLQ